MACPPYIPAERPPRVGFIGSRTTVQSIPDAAITPVTLPTQTSDTNGFFTPGASLGTVVSGFAGLWAISARCSFATVSITQFIRLTVGGLVYDMSGGTNLGSPGDGIVVPLVVGDTIALSAYQASGGPVNVTAASLIAHLIGL